MSRFPRLLLVLTLLFLPGAVRAAEFTPQQRAEIVSIVRQALKQDPSILRDAVAALQADDAMRAQAQQREMILAHHNSLVTPEDPVVGNPHGDVTFVEFFDTRCPYCRKLEPEMQRFLAQDHEVKLVYKDLPILGPASVLGSKALLAAQKQGAYEKMREAVMQLPSDTTMAMIKQTAERLGLDWPQMQKDMQSPEVQARIDANLKLAQALDIEGTPALIVGNQLVPGAVSMADLRKLAEAARKQG